MTDSYVPRVGGILSADIAVPEHEREVRFYSRVLTTGSAPLWREDLMNNRGMPIIGLGERTAEYADLPLLWMPHIQVADVAASVATAVRLGGTELMHGKDEEGDSQWAVLLDPQGVAFGLIPMVPPEMMPQGEGGGPMGCIAGASLTASDAPALRDFYREVIGWTGSDDVMLGGDGQPAAEIHEAAESAGIPPVWLLHLPVDDLAESLRRVEEEGGKVLHVEGDPPTSAVIQDPVGVGIALTGR